RGERGGKRGGARGGGPPEGPRGAVLSVMGPYHSPALAEHVLPDTVGPPQRVLRARFRLTRRELLLDLDDLAALDLVAVDDRDRLAVTDPAVAGVPRRHRGHGLVVEQARDRDRADLPHRVGDVARLRYRQPDRRIADHVNVLVLHRLVGEMVDL